MDEFKKDQGQQDQTGQQGGKPAFSQFDKDQAGGTSLWRIPAAGGEEVKVLDSVQGLRFAVVDSGLYFIEPTVGGPVIRFLRFKTGEITSIAQVDGPVQAGLSVSPDGRFLLYSLGELVGSDLVLVDHFR